MFKEFFLFELRYRLKRPLIYVFAVINMLLLFAATVSDNVQIGGSNDAIHVNSPHAVMSTILLMTLIGVFMTTAIMNTSILRDFDNKFDGILFSAPVSKFGYLGGRFLGATLVALVPFIGAFAGIALGSMMPMLDASQVGPFYFGSYWSTFVLAVIPNTFFISAIVFMLAALFRSNLFSFIGAMAIIVLYIVLLTLMGDLENEKIAILCDPLAINSYGVLTKYWTIDEKNSRWMSFSGLLVINRLLWISLGFVFLLLTYFRFSFARKKPLFQRKSSLLSSKNDEKAPVIGKLEPLPIVGIYDNASSSWKQFVHQTKMEFWGIAKSTPFIVLVVFGILNMSGSLPNVDNMFGTGNHPVTYLMIDAIRGSLYLFVVGILMYYAGVVIWRERDAKMNEFFDASPFPTWIPFTSKLLALVSLLGIILLVSMICGIVFQLIDGYSNLELGVYLRELMVYDYLGFIFITVLAMWVQTMVNNKYLGYFAFIVIMVVLGFGAMALEVESNLVLFGEVPSHIYSDMNRWSVYTSGLAWFNIYWLLFCSLLSIVGILFWVRGKSLTWSQRIGIAKQRMRGNIVYLAAALGVVWLATASFLTYQTKFVNEMVSDNTLEDRQVEYEKLYKKYQHIAQPRITDVVYDLAIFPKERDYFLKSKVSVLNKTQESIDSIHFSLPSNNPMVIKIPGSTIAVNDSIHRYRIYALDNPLLPGAKLTYEVETRYESKGVENEISTTSIVENGTFLSSFNLMPSIGYADQSELTDKKKRKDYGLPVKPRANKLHEGCSDACQNTYISNDSDWVTVSSTVSTSSDQTAIAPGSLMKEWTEEGRNYYQYELKKPVLNFYNFVSARYEIKREIWTSPTGEKVDCEVYYHQGHEYNVDKMMKSLKQSLTYYSKNFSPYPHEQARIIEFPRYASFAQAFPGTMPYSESIGFIADLTEDDAIDMVYYVVAHEMAHQWWAHQIIGANVQGMTMLSESFSQYAALMVMKEEYGEDKMKQFMKYEMDRYLRSRGRETEKELPLMYVENQQYIHYRKGSVVLYALQDYIGEDSLNLALKRYAEAVSYQEPPYTTTLDVMDYIEAVTPDSLMFMIEDMFRTITLHNNRTEDASYKDLGNEKYEVSLEVSIEKYRADSLGRETLIPHNDYIDIGIYSKEKEEGHEYGRPILVERHKISAADTTFIFVVDELPYEAGIDPNYLLVDRMPEDNVKKVVEEK